MITERKALWKQAFGDPDAFIDAFFSIAYDQMHSSSVIWKGKTVAALYWFDCSCRGRKIAYIYAVATEESYRGKGICRNLMESTHQYLRREGYTGAILVPGSKPLFRFYEKLGYQTCSFLDELSCAAGAPVPLNRITPAEYAAQRLTLLPPDSVVQEGVTLDFLASYAAFYAGDGFIAAATLDGDKAQVHELLGDVEPAAVIAALGARKGTVRRPGTGRPFAMYHGLEVAPMPGYFGLALD